MLGATPVCGTETCLAPDIPSLNLHQNPITPYVATNPVQLEGTGSRIWGTDATELLGVGSFSLPTKFAPGAILSLENQFPRLTLC